MDGWMYTSHNNALSIWYPMYVCVCVCRVPVGFLVRGPDGANGCMYVWMDGWMDGRGGGRGGQEVFCVLFLFCFVLFCRLLLFLLNLDLAQVMSS